MVYHGNKERKITKREMAQYDVIITTYGIILSEVKTAIFEFFFLWNFAHTRLANICGESSNVVET